MSKKYIFHEDPGHGWLEVPRDELVALGIEAKITPYSYQTGTGVITTYLEEDCDMGTFFDAYKLKYGVEPEYTVRAVNGQSRIRTFGSYQAPLTDHVALEDDCWCVNCQEWRIVYEMIAKMIVDGVGRQFFVSQTRRIRNESPAWKYILEVADIDTITIKPGAVIPPLKGEYIKMLDGERQDVKKTLGTLGMLLYLVEDRSGRTYTVCPFSNPNVTWTRCWQEIETSVP